MINRYQGGWIAPIIISLFLARGCSRDPDVPFNIDTGTGTFTFTTENHPSESFRIKLNGNSVLKKCYIFQETDSVVCINSLDELDIISVFKENSSAGSIRISIINAGKENRSVNDFHIQSVRVNSHWEFDIISYGGNPWRFCRHEKNDTLLFSLQNYGTPVILLPGEKLELPQVNLVNRGKNSTF